MDSTATFFEAVEEQLDAELRFHLDQQTAEYVARGMSPEEAHRRAQIEMAGVEQVKQRCRERRWENRVEGVVRDIRFAMRRLGKEPRFSLTAIFALSLGIGSTTLVFSLVYNLLFQPFPYRSLKRSTVVRIHDISETGNDGRGLFSILSSSHFENRTTSSRMSSVTTMPLTFHTTMAAGHARYSAHMAQNPMPALAGHM